MIQLLNINKAFGKVRVLNNISFSVNQGQASALIGPSGSGKTTLLRLISGLDKPDSGKITIRETVASDPEIILPPYSRGLGVVFQKPCLWSHMTVEQNITFGLSSWKPNDAKTRFEELVCFAKLNGLEKRFPHQISGGEAQRVALARAIAPRPLALLLDEPFSNLDNELQQEMIALISDLKRDSNITIVIVSHDHLSLVDMSEKVVVLQKGEIQFDGAWKDAPSYLVSQNRYSMD